MSLSEDVMGAMKERFHSYEIDAQALAAAVRNLQKQPGAEKLPEALKRLAAGQANLEFQDIVNLCRMMAEEDNAVSAFVERYHTNRAVGPLELISMLENHIAETLCRIDEVYSLPEVKPDKGGLSRELQLIHRYWRPGASVNNALKFLIQKQVEAGSFRAWLEQQPFTMQIAQDFAKLGLDYSKWDNPATVYYFSNGEFKTAAQGMDVVKSLAQKFTRGEYRGYLAIPPKELWKKIAPYYALQTKEQQLKVLAGIQESLKPNTSVEKELQEAAQKMSCEEAEPDASEYNIAFHAWRRKPSHDFCAGNEAGVCTATSGCNSEAMPNYLVDKAVSLIDINIRGKRVGQIYLVAMHKRGKPVLLLDTLEASTSVGMSDALYQPALLAAESIGRQAGFCRIMVQGHAFNAHARNFYRFVQCQPCYELKSETLTKIGSTKPLRVLKQFEHEQEAGGMHYFDAGASFDGEQWRSSWSNVPVQGLVMALKQQG